ncbi:MAG: Stp1/IreP family PP2C-type Ser/Thr phosphatase [Anaerolineales bacterium]|nr:Stp1/IreP family PP2C-type Ser/Thr phosphatase [Anaerolineales bacterium]
MTGKNNEDAYGFTAWQQDDRRLYLAVVADGVGGQTAGELASHIVVEQMMSYFAELPELATRNVLNHLLQAITQANTAVYARSQSDKKVQGMATTVVVTAIYNGRLFTSHVGDSRIYFWRNEQLHQITQDHSWVQEAVDAGLLTAEQARTHPNRNVIRRSLGTAPETQVDQTPLSPGAFLLKQGMPLQKNDTLLLCSDGLSDMIDDSAIAQTLAKHGEDLHTAVDDLIQQANDAGGRDNITVMLVRMLEGVSPMSDEELDTPTPPTATASGDPTTPTKNPRVVPVPLDKKQKEQRARQRRFILLAVVALFIMVALIALYLFMNGWM